MYFCHKCWSNHSCLFGNWVYILYIVQLIKEKDELKKTIPYLKADTRLTYPSNFAFYNYHQTNHDLTEIRVPNEMADNSILP